MQHVIFSPVCHRNVAGRQAQGWFVFDTELAAALKLNSFPRRHTAVVEQELVTSFSDGTKVRLPCIFFEPKVSDLILHVNTLPVVRPCRLARIAVWPQIRMLALKKSSIAATMLVFTALTVLCNGASDMAIVCPFICLARSELVAVAVGIFGLA